MKRIGAIAAVILLAAAAVAGACELHFYLIDAEGVERPLSADGGSSADPVHLELGQQYILRIVYLEDHRNCEVRPEDTLLLLDGARWRVGRETQPLVLAAPVTWSQPRTRTHEGEVRFTAAAAGTWTLEFIRECDRGGYHGQLLFEVTG